MFFARDEMDFSLTQIQKLDDEVVSFFMKESLKFALTDIYDRKIN